MSALGPIYSNFDIKYSSNNRQGSLTFPIPVLTHINRFFKTQHVAIDMLQTGVFPNAKEISESMAAVAAAEKHIGWTLLKKINPIIFVVGDGATPRTGVSFAFKTGFNVISIDPNFSKVDYPQVNRLACFRTKLKDFCDDYIYLIDRCVVLVSVHGHIPRSELIKFHNLVGQKLFAIVEIPCCTPNEFTHAFSWPSISYEDWGIFSPHRTVKIWKFKRFDEETL